MREDGSVQSVLLMSAPQSSANNGRDSQLLDGLLSNLRLFRPLQHRHVLQVAAQSRTLRLRRGTVLYRKGERLPGVVAVAYGSLKLALRRNGGDEKVLRFVGPNETFGEAALLLDRPCPVDVVALADTMVAVIPPQPVLRLMATDVGFARNAACLLGESFLDLVGELEAVQRNGVRRLAAYLDSLVEPNGSGWIVRLPANKTTVAARLGVTKETMSRLLRELINRGLIQVARREVLIVDREKLALLAA
jgi:CRP/FNR family transcriptional regulator, dissimilatory nitrate respiration regulator